MGKNRQENRSSPTSTTMEDAVVARGIWKGIKGRQVLRGVSLRVPRGTVTVIAGPNGAGKTTLVRVLLGIYRPDRGIVRLLGHEPGGPGWERVAGRLGYLPEDASPYERLTGYENLLYYALIYTGGDREAAEGLVKRAASLSGLSPGDLSRRAGEYSKGMKRRLLLAASLMHDPDLAVLDEPTSGLDVFSATRVRGVIRGYADSGGTVLLTTHNLLEAQYVADRVVFLSQGRVVFEGTVEEALSRYGAVNLEEAFVEAVEGGSP